MKISTSKKNTDDFDTIIGQCYRTITHNGYIKDGYYGIKKIILINGITNIIQAHKKDNHLKGENINIFDIRIEISEMVNSIPDSYFDKEQLPLIIKYNLLVLGYSLGASENRSIDELVYSIF